MSQHKFTRRQVIATGVAAGAALALPSIVRSDAATKPFRIAHLTDMHVQPERRAGEGYTACLESLQKLTPAPDLIITGGDHVMDSTDQELPRAKTIWDLFDRTMQHAPTGIPVRHVLGNHDIFAWGKKEVPDSTAGYGKAMAMDRLKLERPYYSFMAGGWKFIMLDSMTRREFTYLGLLGPEQTEWLKGELQSTPANQPMIVFSHIPILSVAVFFDGKDRLREREWNVPDSWMHHDMLPIVDLLASHNVKLAVSGHIHLLDRADYRNVSFICDGAVCGNWWKGVYHECPEGYGVLDLHPDGRFEHQYITYGWKADKA